VLRSPKEKVYTAQLFSNYGREEMKRLNNHGRQGYCAAKKTKDFFSKEGTSNCMFPVCGETD
jgi:hypothetical protein